MTFLFDSEKFFISVYRVHCLRDYYGATYNGLAKILHEALLQFWNYFTI